MEMARIICSSFVLGGAPKIFVCAPICNGLYSSSNKTIATLYYSDGMISCVSKGCKTPQCGGLEALEGSFCVFVPQILGALLDFCLQIVSTAVYGALTNLLRPLPPRF